MEIKETVFVIEDSKIISEILSLQLKQKFNCNTITFENADKAMNDIEKYSPALIILDYNFNDEDLKYASGLDFLIALRKNHKTPVIVFSGQGDKDKADEIIKEGANHYISKEDDDFFEDLLARAEKEMR